MKYSYDNYLTKLPGNHTKEEALQRMMRVNQAGELAAVEIYRWQARIMPSLSSELKLMQAQEENHLSFFDHLLAERDLQKSKLNPIWKAAGMTLGGVTAIMGKKAARACTEAVEEVIVEHYDQQLEILKQDPDEEKLTSKIEQIRDEELEHSREAGDFSKEKVGFRERILYKFIYKGCKAAIAAARKI